MPPSPLNFDSLTTAQRSALRDQAFSVSGVMSDAAMDCIRDDLVQALGAGESIAQFRARLRDSLDASCGGAHG